MLKLAFLATATLISLEAFASPIAGLWQGPCEVRGTRSVMFTYNISPLDDGGVGSIAKTKIYYDDTSCSVYNHTGRQTVAYRLGAASDDGVYPLDVMQRTRTFYDIVQLSEDGSQLAFGEKFVTTEDERPTVLSTTHRLFVRVES
jgi:hypothetical protein